MPPRPTLDITDTRIVRALGHPLRARILVELDEGIASPSELSEKLGERIGTVSYHVRVLADLGLLRLVKKTPRRGAVEHHYSATPRPKLDERAWKDLPRSARRAVAAGAATKVADALTEAARQGGFERPGSELAAPSLSLDAKGWKEAAKELRDVSRRLTEISKDSAARQRADGTEAIPAAAVLGLFALPGDADRRSARG